MAHGLRLAAEGADIVDVGGESTRPGAQRVDAAEELRRIGPVISGLAAAGVLVSVDTMRAGVAELALGAGARHGQRRQRGPGRPAAAPAGGRGSACPYVVAHWRGYGRDMQQRAVYDDVVREVGAELRRQVDAVIAAGVDPSDGHRGPGARLRQAGRAQLGAAGQPRRDRHARRRPPFPVLVGASRKSFLGSLLTGADGEPRPPDERDGATVAVSALAAAAGAWCVRVHAVAANADAVRVAARWAAASGLAVPAEAAGPANGTGAPGTARATGTGDERGGNRPDQRCSACARSAGTACSITSAATARSSWWTRCSGWIPGRRRPPTTWS